MLKDTSPFGGVRFLGINTDFFGVSQEYKSVDSVFAQVTGIKKTGIICVLRRISRNKNHNKREHIIVITMNFGEPYRCHTEFCLI